MRGSVPRGGCTGTQWLSSASTTDSFTGFFRPGTHLAASSASSMTPPWMCQNIADEVHTGRLPPMSLKELLPSFLKNISAVSPEARSVSRSAPMSQPNFARSALRKPET